MTSSERVSLALAQKRQEIGIQITNYMNNISIKKVGEQPLTEFLEKGWSYVLYVLPWVGLLLLIGCLSAFPRIRRMRRRKRLIQRLEQKQGAKVIAMIHRGGGPLRFLTGGGGYIGMDDAETILRILRQTPLDQPIDLLLHTPGGLVLSTAQIARALKNHPARVRVIIPHMAMSGGTFLALAADEIMMDPNAVLGPVDPQTFKFPDRVAMASVLRVIREKSKDRIEDSTWILADQAEKAIRQIAGQIAGLLADRMGDERAQELAHTFTEGRWTHDHPLTCEVLESFGLKVSTAVPEEAYELLAAFPEGARFRSVQWLAGKKRTKKGDEQSPPKKT